MSLRDAEHIQIDLTLCFVHPAMDAAFWSDWKALSKRCAIGLRKKNLCVVLC